MVHSQFSLPPTPAQHTTTTNVLPLVHRSIQKHPHTEIMGTMITSLPAIGVSMVLLFAVSQAHALSRYSPLHLSLSLSLSCSSSASCRRRREFFEHTKRANGHTHTHHRHELHARHARGSSARQPSQWSVHLARVLMHAQAA